MENNLPVNIHEYQELAKKALPKMHYDYINGGAEDEYTLRENIAAYGRILLRPRVLVDVSKIDMSTSLLGYGMPSPIIIAPTGAHKLANPEGEVATARAAASCNTIMVLSFSSNCKIEEVASSCNAIRFYQLYVYKRRDVSATLVRRAESCGFKAIVLTVDTPVLGRREADIRNKMVAPRNANLEGLMSIDDLDTTGGSKLERYARETLDPSLSWKQKMENDLPVNVREYQELAKKALSKTHYDFINGGAEDEYTLRENIAAYGRIMLRPRVLVDVSRIEMSTSLLGYDMPSPIIVAPTGTHIVANPEGEVATARAAAACNAVMVLSYSSSRKIEDVASSCNAIRFYQLYVIKDRHVTVTLIRRVESCGFKAIVLTVDTPLLGRREADIRNKLVPPRNPNLRGLVSIEDLNKGRPKDPSLSWKDVEWLKSITSLPILLKGILSAEDARRAVEAGAAGVIVSNHGGRQLDYVPATISALEEVVKAVAGAVPVLVDGGIRRGTDVLKALALGARAVMVGRPVFYGLAARGEAGAKHVIEMLNRELELAMALCGCRSVGGITRSHVQTEGDRIRSLL